MNLTKVSHAYDLCHHFNRSNERHLLEENKETDSAIS